MTTLAQSMPTLDEQIVSMFFEMRIQTSKKASNAIIARNHNKALTIFSTSFASLEDKQIEVSNFITFILSFANS